MGIEAARHLGHRELAGPALPGRDELLPARVVRRAPRCHLNLAIGETVILLTLSLRRY